MPISCVEVRLSIIRKITGACLQFLHRIIDDLLIGPPLEIHFYLANTWVLYYFARTIIGREADCKSKALIRTKFCIMFIVLDVIFLLYLVLIHF